MAYTPLQQSLNNLNEVDHNLFNSCQIKRKGIKVKPPLFKSIN